MNAYSTTVESQTHKYHQSKHTVANVCCECSIEILNGNFKVWQKKVMLEKLCLVTANGLDELAGMLEREKPAWLMKFVCSILELTLSPLPSLVESALAVSSGLSALSYAHEDCISQHMWKWVVMNSSKTTAIIIRIVMPLIAQKTVQNQRHSNLLVLLIIRSFENPADACMGMNCLKAFLQVYKLYPRQANHLYSIVFRLIDSSQVQDVKQSAAEVILILQERYADSLHSSEVTVEDHSSVFKKILITSNTSLATSVCKIVLNILQQGSNATALENSLIRADCFEILTDSLNASSDAAFLSVALSGIERLANRITACNEFPICYGLERLIRSCKDLRTKNMMTAMEQTLFCIKSIIKGNMTQRPLLTAQAQQLLFNLANNVLSERNTYNEIDCCLLDVFSHIISHNHLLFEGSILSLKKLISMLTGRLLMLPFHRNHCEMYNQSVSLCVNILRFSTMCKTANLNICLPAQIREVEDCVLILVDQFLIVFLSVTVGDSVIEGAASSILLFTLLNAFVQTNSAMLKPFLDKFIGCGGLMFTLTMTRWEKADESLPISQFLITLLQHAFPHLERLYDLQAADIGGLPENTEDLVHHLADILYPDKLLICMTVLSVIQRTDSNELNSLLLIEKLNSLDCQLIKSMEDRSVVLLGKLFACAYHSASTEQNLIIANQGIMRLVLDRLDCLFVDVIGRDLVLLQWVADFTDSNSTLCEHMILDICNGNQSDEFDREKLLACMLSNPFLLDTFMIHCLTQSIDCLTARHYLTSILQSLTASNKRAALSNVLEVRLTELCYTRILDCDLVIISNDEHLLFYIIAVVQIMQSSIPCRSQLLEHMKLFNTLLKVLPTLLSHNIQMFAALCNYLTTLLSWSLTLKDSTVADMLLHSEDILSALQCCLDEMDEKKKTCAINIFTVLCESAQQFSIEAMHAVQIPASLCLNAFDSSSLLLQMTVLQLWYAHLGELISTPTSIHCINITPTHTDNMGDNYSGFTEPELRVLYIFIQQRIIFSQSVFRTLAIKVVCRFIKYLKIVNADLAKRMLTQPWNKVAISHCLEQDCTDRMIPFFSMMMEHFGSTGDSTDYMLVRNHVKSLSEIPVGTGADDFLTPFIHWDDTCILCI